MAFDSPEIKRPIGYKILSPARAIFFFRGHLTGANRQHQNAVLVRVSTYGSLTALGNGARVLLVAAPYRPIAIATSTVCAKRKTPLR